ncbi:MAG: polyprenyl diphosphate synthase [bacterium]
MDNLPEPIPRHVAFVLDGNRRWARERGLPTLEGHLRGMDNIENIVEWCVKAGIGYLTVYAFSTENWDRSAEELNYLFNVVFPKGFGKSARFNEQNVRVNLFGSVEKFPAKMQDEIRDLIDKTQENTGLQFNVCLNYSGRTELVQAVQAIMREGTPVDQVIEQTIADHLFSAGMPDPDLMIRTGGEHRLSGFLLWQQAYTELYFPKKYLPEFSEADFREALQWYAERDRRHGK